MSTMPQDKAELINAIESEWRQLIQVADSLSDQQMTTPDAGGWSPKDNLAHLAEWMDILMGYHMDRLPAHQVLGVPEQVTRGWKMEVINPILYERNKDTSRGDVMQKISRTYEKLLARLESTPFERLM